MNHQVNDDIEAITTCPCGCGKDVTYESYCENVVECNGKHCDETNFSTKKQINQSKFTGI